MKLKRTCILVVLIAALTLLFGSCIQIYMKGPLSVYTEEPEETESEPASASPAPLISSSITYLEDASAIRPVYNSANRPVYDISVVFSDDLHSAVVSQTVKYTNTAADSMSELYMHIYPNNFSKQEYVSMAFSSEDETVYPDDKFNPGGIEIASVAVNGDPAGFEITGADETILEIPLGAPLTKGNSAEIGLEYSIKIPNCMGRYAWGEVGTSVANWYPIMAVYDSEWNLDQYYELGDPFYSETGDYTVTLDIPEGVEAAHTGDVLSDSTKNGRRVLSLSETGVRDFAFALSRKYFITSEKVEGVEVRVAVPSKHEDIADDVLRYAKDALSLFSRLYGAYTNDALTVAFTDSYGGMEYPGLVFISAQLLEDGEDGEDSFGGLFMVEEIVVHEVAHQWWYSAVGNDEIDEAWLDEGLASFSGMAYYGETLGWDVFGDFWEERDEDNKLDKSLPAYSSWDDYIYVYTFGQSFFKSLMDILGKEQFYGVLQKYYADHAYGIATAEDLRGVIAQTGSSEALAWFDKSVYGE